MKIFLLSNIKNLGFIGDIVEVKNGFFRNYLLRYNKAINLDKSLFKNINFLKKKLYFLYFKNINFYNLFINILKNKKFFCDPFNFNKNNILLLLKLNGFYFYKNQIIFFDIFNKEINLYYVILNIFDCYNIKIFICFNKF